MLRGLAGPAARLRDDQWTAIHALVVQRRRALVVQRTGWGKSAVYFVATALLHDQCVDRRPLVVAEPRGRPREPAQHFFGTGAQSGVGTLGRRHHTIVTPTPDNSAIGAHP